MHYGCHLQILLQGKKSEEWSVASSNEMVLLIIGEVCVWSLGAVLSPKLHIVLRAIL